MTHFEHGRGDGTGWRTVVLRRHAPITQVHDPLLVYKPGTGMRDTRSIQLIPYKSYGGHDSSHGTVPDSFTSVKQKKSSIVSIE